MAHEKIFSEQSEVINEQETKEEFPLVLERHYNDKGKLIGMDILVSSETIPVTGKEYAEWYQTKYPQ